MLKLRATLADALKLARERGVTLEVVIGEFAAEHDR